MEMKMKETTNRYGLTARPVSSPLETHTPILPQMTVETKETNKSEPNTEMMETEVVANVAFTRHELMWVLEVVETAEENWLQERPERIKEGMWEEEDQRGLFTLMKIHDKLMRA